MVRTGTGATLVSTDGGTTFAAAPANTAAPADQVVAIGKETWEITRTGP